MRSSQDGITTFFCPSPFSLSSVNIYRRLGRWVESKIHQLTQTPEEQLIEAMAKSRKTLPEIRKKAEEGSASDLFTMGYAYEFGEGLPQSHSIAVQYYLKAYEKAIEQTDVETRRAASSALSRAYLIGRAVPRNDAEREKWMQRARDARAEIDERQKAERQKLIEEHEAMIPQ